VRQVTKLASPAVIKALLAELRTRCPEGAAQLR